MHPLRKLRESGKPTLARISALLAENIVFNSASGPRFHSLCWRFLAGLCRRGNPVLSCN
jgi:hypothetical protein